MPLKHHILVQPFAKEATAQWRRREWIINALKKCHEAADEAWLCLNGDPDQRDLDQADKAMADLDKAIEQLKANR